jgi:hypothetical protein
MTDTLRNNLDICKKATEKVLDKKPGFLRAWGQVIIASINGGFSAGLVVGSLGGARLSDKINDQLFPGILMLPGILVGYAGAITGLLTGVVMGPVLAAGKSAYLAIGAQRSKRLIDELDNYIIRGKLNSLEEAKSLEAVIIAGLQNIGENISDEKLADILYKFIIQGGDKYNDQNSLKMFVNNAYTAVRGTHFEEDLKTFVRILNGKIQEGNALRDEEAEPPEEPAQIYDSGSPLTARAAVPSTQEGVEEVPQPEARRPRRP